MDMDIEYWKIFEIIINYDIADHAGSAKRVIKVLCSTFANAEKVGIQYIKDENIQEGVIEEIKQSQIAIITSDDFIN